MINWLCNCMSCVCLCVEREKEIKQTVLNELTSNNNLKPQLDRNSRSKDAVNIKSYLSTNTVNNNMKQLFWGWFLFSLSLTWFLMVVIVYNIHNHIDLNSYYSYYLLINIIYSNIHSYLFICHSYIYAIMVLLFLLAK